jgi:hypothetical protein
MGIWGVSGWICNRHLMAVGLVTFVASALMVVCIGEVASGSALCANGALRTGASADLPDCRAYEQVSPVAKGGFAALPKGGTPVQTSPSGDAISYLGFNAFPGALGSSALHAAHVSTRAASGWETADRTPAVPKAEGLKIYKVDYAFSEDLTQAVIRVPFIPLAAGSTPYTYNLFLQHSDGRYSLVNSALPAIPIEAFCGPEEIASCFEFLDISSFAGASGDFSHVAFESTSQLTAQAPGPFVESLYESAGGEVRLVGILPDGTAAGSSTAGAGSSVHYSDGQSEADGRVEHAVSQDGSRIVFQAPADSGEPHPAQAGLTEVYDRVEGRETVELSAPEAGSTPEDNTPRAATFWAASVDGSRVYLTSAADLTTQSKTGSEGGEDLYEYNFDRPAGEKLVDLSVDSNPVDAASGAKVLGVVDASSDGSYVYFVAKGELVSGKGVDGQPNLYMEHDGAPPVFIATLSGAGTCSLQNRVSADACDWTPFLPQLEAYVTPDGHHLAFMSTMRLPTVGHPGGYDNTDHLTGEADSEVYEYDAQAGSLVCGSCDTSGASPTGDALIGGIIWTQQREHGEQFYVGLSTPFQHVRAMNDAGTQLFYNAPSPSGSSPSKVYEYEQAGEGSCGDTGGCKYLLSSSGTDIEQYLGLGANGSDAFFATTRQLVATDDDSLRDVYDARVNGGFAAPSSESVCQGDCRAGGSSSDESPSLVGYLTGSSGNSPARQRARSLTTTQRLAKALKTCRAKKNRHRRAHCELVARHRYGIVTKSSSDRKGRR